MRAGLLELSQAWASLGRKCTLLAEAQTVSHTASLGGASDIPSISASVIIIILYSISQGEAWEDCTCIYMYIMCSGDVVTVITEYNVQRAGYSCIWCVIVHSTQAWCVYGLSLQELAQLIPDVNTRLEEVPPYTDSRESQKIIYSTRSRLERLEPPAYSSAAIAASSSSSSLPPYETSSRPPSAGSKGTRRTSSGSGHHHMVRGHGLQHCTHASTVPVGPGRLELCVVSVVVVIMRLSMSRVSQYNNYVYPSWREVY